MIQDSKRQKTFAFLIFLLLVALPYLKLEAKAKPQLMKKYDKIIETAALKYDIPADLVHSIIQTESNYNSQAISPKGAIGLMQLMPETAKEYGVENIYDPKENIEGGVKYLRDLIKLYNKKTNLVLAAYNAGQEAIKKYKGIPPYPETKNYIEKVMASFNKSTIRARTKIYKFYDDSGKLILTNTPYFFSINSKKED